MDATVSKSIQFPSHRLHHNALYRLFVPFLFIMRIGGVFFLPLENWQAQEHLQKPSVDQESRPISLYKQGRYAGRRVLETFSSYYSFMVFLWITAYFAANIYNDRKTLQEFETSFTVQKLPGLVFAITSILWQLHCISGYLIFSRASWCELTVNFFIKWESLQYPCLNQNCKTFSEFFRPRRNIVLLCMMTLIAILIFSSWRDAIGAALQPSSFSGRNNYADAKIIVDLVGHFFMSMVNYVPAFFMVLTGYVLQEEFRHLTYEMAQQINDDGDLTGRLEWFRLRHEKLCSLLYYLDEICSLPTLITLGISIIQMFFLVYLVIYGTFAEVSLKLQMGFWFFTYLLQPGLMLWIGTKVGTAAHSPLSLLHRLDHSKLTVLETLQLHTFLTKLTGEQIGFTAGSVFNMDSTAVLSIAGAYITYQILLIQLQFDLKTGNSGGTNESDICTTAFENITTALN